MIAIDHAKSGVLKFFEEAPLDILLNARDSSDDTVLSSAVSNDHLDCCKVICEKCPSLLYYQPRRGSNGTPLQIAAYKGHLDILKLLISACIKADQGEDRAGKQKTLMLTNNYGSNAMHKAVHGQQPESIKLLIEADPNNELLKACDRKKNTPLHVAVGKSEHEIARWLIKADPDFQYGANSDGKTPLLIAIDNGAESQNHRVSEMLKIIMELQPTQSKVGVPENGWTALHYCVSKKYLDTLGYIIQSCPESSKVPDNEGQSVFHHAVKLGNVEMIKVIYKACPSLIYHRSKDGSTVLHQSAMKGEPKMLNFLIEAGTKSYNNYAEDDIESGGGEKIPQKMLLTMIDDQGDTALHKAVQNNKLEAVKLLLEAAPDYEYGANTFGDTPIMISAREARSKENKFVSGKIRKMLFKLQSNQTMARRGDNGWTVLHQATSDGDLIIVEDIIKFCSSCAEVVDNEGKNFLHIAAMSGRIEVVRLVLREKNIPVNVLNKKDSEGNTPFHIAAQIGNEPLTKCFLFDERINKNTVNKQDQHVLNAIKFLYDKRRAGVLGIAGTDESDYKEQREFDLVVGALIATVSFTAGITVPGGYNSEGPNQGTAVFSKEVSFAAFIISNTFALIFSLYAVFSHFCARQMSKAADTEFQLNVAALCTLAAIYSMMAAFIAGSFAVLANSYWLAAIVCIISCVFFILACHPIWKIAKQMLSKLTASPTSDEDKRT